MDDFKHYPSFSSSSLFTFEKIKQVSVPLARKRRISTENRSSDLKKKKVLASLAGGDGRRMPQINPVSPPRHRSVKYSLALLENPPNEK